MGSFKGRPKGTPPFWRPPKNRHTQHRKAWCHHAPSCTQRGRGSKSRTPSEHPNPNYNRLKLRDLGKSCRHSPPPPPALSETPTSDPRLLWYWLGIEGHAHVVLLDGVSRNWGPSKPQMLAFLCFPPQSHTKKRSPPKKEEPPILVWWIVFSLFLVAQ